MKNRAIATPPSPLGRSHVRAVDRRSYAVLASQAPCLVICGYANDLLPSIGRHLYAPLSQVFKRYHFADKS